MIHRAFPVLLGLLVPGVALAAAGTPAPGGAESLVWQAPGGVTLTVTADGLSSIRLKDRVVAAGGWYAWNAGPAWFGLGTKDVLAYGGYSRDVYAAVAHDVAEKSIEVLGPTRARVRHVQPHAVATYEYAFDGEDVTLQARLENHHPTADLAVPAFGGLEFTFRRLPEGHMIVWHMSYLQAITRGAFHPSHQNKLGGSYATDGTAGIGLTPIETGLARTLLFWDFADWNPGKRENVPVRWLSYLRADPIPAGGALTFKMKMRVSARTGWQHLLAPYKDHFAATFGAVRYAANARLVAVAHVNRNVESITPDNPYGFHGGFRRLDLPEGAGAVCDLLIPALKEANGQGLIFWGQGGENPRGAMYRPDFDILPPEVEKNWAAMSALP